jgi:SAM-dependent methyltransferase
MPAEKLFALYSKEMFCPSWLGLFINPFYIIRSGLHRGIRDLAAACHGRLLDFGCGHKPYQSVFNVSEYIGLDIEKSGHNHRKSNVDVFYDGRHIPFPDDHFDTILASEVFEHVFNFNEIFPELLRVLKPGGRLLITVPFVWEEHEIPYDFARYTSFGLEHLMKTAGLDVLGRRKTTNYIETLAQMLNAYILQNLFPKNIVFRLLLTPFVFAPISLIGLAFGRLLPDNQLFYHNNVLLLQKPIREKVA